MRLSARLQLRAREASILEIVQRNDPDIAQVDVQLVNSADAGSVYLIDQWQLECCSHILVDAAIACARIYQRIQQLCGNRSGVHCRHGCLNRGRVWMNETGIKSDFDRDGRAFLNEQIPAENNLRRV